RNEVRLNLVMFFFSSRRRHTRFSRDWSSDVCSSDLDGGRLVAAAPGYLKTNSHGEFVFDHAWAHAYARHGLDYFPKLLCAVPYSPVTGSRLLAPSHLQAPLLDAIAGSARAAGASSAHVNFHTEAEDAAFDDAWLPRTDVQYHWRNDAGWASFD